MNETKIKMAHQSQLYPKHLKEKNSQHKQKPLRNQDKLHPPEYDSKMR